MLNLHRFGLILIIGGFIAIGSSIIAAAGKQDVLLSTVSSIQGGKLESGDAELRRWSPRERYEQRASSDDDDEEVQQPLPTASSNNNSDDEDDDDEEVQNTRSSSGPTSGSSGNQITLGAKKGYVDSGDVHLSKGESVGVVCMAQSMNIDKSNSEWEILCRGSSVDDHVDVTCSNGLSALSQSSSSVVVGCGSSSSSSSPPVSSSNNNTQSSNQPSAARTQPSSGPTSGSSGNQITLGAKKGYVDSGDVHLSKGESVGVVCMAQSMNIDKSNSEWEILCRGSSVDDHVDVTCSNGLSALSQSSSSVVVGCGSNSSSSPPVSSSNNNTQSSNQSSAARTQSSSSPSVAPAAQPAVLPPAGPAVPSGQTISNPNGTCIEARTPGQVIENVTIGPCGETGIDILAPNVTVRNVTIRQANTSIRVYQTSGARIENNRLENPVSHGGYEQQISVDKSSGVIIRNNALVCSGSCQQEDAIGVFQSSNVLIEGNSISGGKSESGCGIMADSGTSQVVARNNTIRDQVNCGIGIANGTGHVVEGNNVSGYGNVGIYVWNQYGGQCSNIRVVGNTVAGNNPWWSGGNCSQVTVSGNNFEND